MKTSHGVLSHRSLPDASDLQIRQEAQPRPCTMLDGICVFEMRFVRTIQRNCKPLQANAGGLRTIRFNAYSTFDGFTQSAHCLVRAKSQFLQH